MLGEKEQQGRRVIGLSQTDKEKERCAVTRGKYWVSNQTSNYTKLAMED